MEKIYELRDELMKHKMKGFAQFTLQKGEKWLQIDDLIAEIDNLRVCNCPPTDNNS
jgi:hypothetical protein